MKYKQQLSVRCSAREDSKGKKCKKDKKGQRKSTRIKDIDNKKKGACHNCKVVGHSCVELPEKEEERATQCKLQRWR